MGWHCHCFTESGEDMESMLQCADKALYEAKAAGRNCFRAYRGGE